MWKRLTTLTAIGLFAAVPLAAAVGATPAFADTGVTFSGGGVILLCGSAPSTPQISVVAETAVMLTNATGTDAQLTLDGQPAGSVTRGETVEVRFHRGPVSVAMVPTCALNLAQAKTLTVNVTPAPVPAQSTGSPKPSPKPSSSAAPGGTTGSTGGTPPLPGEPLFTDPSSAAVGGAPAPGSSVEASPATVVNADGTPVHNTAETGPVDKGPIGLLAIIATICVVGVSAGAIRAIITQRASRLELA